jgi:hypothetical protein
MPEPTSIDPVVQSIDRATIAGVAQAALGATAELSDWHVEPINPGWGSATGAMYRVTGSALLDRRTVRWSSILKVLHLTASNTNPAARDVDHPLYWEREALAYQSGLLEDLPGGLTAPRCLGVTRRPDDALWLWLEEAREQYGPRWPLDQYARSARCLGRFNGAYLAGRPIPTHLWLCGPASLRGMLDYFAGFEDVIRDPQAWQQPLVRRAIPASAAPRLLRLWAERAPLIDALERLPQTLSHKDAWRRNMFAPTKAGTGAPDALVMIDWAYVGRGELGLDAGDLFAASYSLFGVEPCDPRELDRVVFEHYLDGLHAAGWTGDWRAARFGYAAYAALKYGCLTFWLRDAGDPSSHAAWERLAGCTMAAYVENQGRLVAYLLDLADEARSLLEAVGSKQSAVSSKQ